MADTSNEVILERVEAVIRRQDTTIDKLDELNGCVRDVQIDQATHRSEINTLTKNQDELRKNSNRNDGIVGGVLLGAVAAKELIKELFTQ